MGDLEVDTAVRPCGDGRFEATLSADWEIWGPMGGYVAACALRAAGAATEHTRPASFSCHYLRVAEFGTVDIRVETRKRGRAASSQRVEISQGGRAILDASVWTVSDNEGLEHDETNPPDVPDPDGLPTIQELLPDDAPPPFAFWRNLDAKPIEFEVDWPPSGPRPGSLAGVVALPADGDVRRSVGRRRPLRDPRRPAELAVGASPARVDPTAIHGPDARFERRVPSSDDGPAVAALRRRRAPFDRGPLRMERARLVSGRPAPCLGRRAVPVPPASSGPLARRPVASSLTPGNSSPEGVSYGCTAPSSRVRSSLAASSGNAVSRFASGPASADVRDHQSSNESARSGVEISSTTTSSRSASCNRRVTRSASSSANGPGTPGGGTGAPSWALTASSKTASHGLRARGPHTTAARRPPRSQHAAHLPQCLRGIEREHETVATQHDVVGRVGLFDLLEIELTRPDVVEPECAGAGRGDRRHLGDDIRHHDLAVRCDERRRGQAEPAGSARQFEHPFARPRCRAAPASAPSPTPRARRRSPRALATIRRRSPTWRASGRRCRSVSMAPPCGISLLS